MEEETENLHRLDKSRGRSGMGLEVLESTVQYEDPISGEGRRSNRRNL